MDKSVIVAIIGAVFGVVGGVGSFVGNVIMWKMERKAKLEDTAKEENNVVDDRLALLEKGQSAQGRIINDIATIQKMTVDGVSYLVDGLEMNGILNGTGKQYLKDINNYYATKGFESLKFHSLSGKKPSLSKKKVM